MNATRRLVSMLALIGACAVATVGVTAPAAAGDDEPAPAKKQARPPSAVDLALGWLARHQSESGLWRAAEFTERCDADDACTGGGEAAHDLGVTGLALLAFLGAGETHNSGEHKDTVKNGLRSLLGTQRQDGGFGPRTSSRFLHDQAICAQVVCEAYGLTGSRLFKDRAQAAVDFLAAARNPKLAWRYGVRDGESDTVVTAAVARALVLARMAELDPDADALAGALAWLDEVTDPKTGAVGYRKRGDAPARYEKRFPATDADGLTAVGTMARFLVHRTDREAALADAALWKGVDAVSARPPVWSDKTVPDLYGWLHGAQAMFQAGADRFDPWFAALCKAILPRQRTAEGCARGSWDPVGAWGKEGGRVYATATLCDALESPYRYGRWHDFAALPDKTDK